jgi:hypothetical protein
VGDGSKHVALAEADVEQSEALRPRRRTLEEGEGRPGGERPAIHPAEVVQHRRIDIRRQRRIVHLLVGADPVAERGHGVRVKWKPSAASPGPKARAIP